LHTDARTLPNDTLIEGDVCIVGAGAAGISLALEWVGTRHRVILLEGGGFDFEPALQDRYRGAIVGQPYFPLDRARLHFFGGTTNHWAGFCAPYDPIDFETREWVPYSGWPMSRATLDPYYARAQQIVELGPYEYELPYWAARDAELRELPLDPATVWTKMWQFSPPTRFGIRYRDAVLNSTNVHLFTYANVCDIELTDDATAVAQLHTRSVGEGRQRVRAQHYVLACGSIQNARLLLASNRQTSAGVGNAHDLVGRYFMEHLELPAAELVMARAESHKLYALNWGHTRARGELALTPAAQRRLRVLNATFELQPGAASGELRSTFQEFPPELLDQFMERERRVASGEIERSPPPVVESSAERWFTLRTRSEQAPNPQSRVRLARDTDALGMPRVELDWQLTELDKRSIRRLCEALGREFGRAGLGRVRILDWLIDGDDARWPPFLSGGWHHMGTTRMHENPRQGVVDADCRVHGVANLHVAGASVFPTGGAANPTLTLIALTLRLSEHLKTRIASTPAVVTAGAAAAGVAVS
jgi:choline dehydrogenase-like flavoprotein